MLIEALVNETPVEELLDSFKVPEAYRGLYLNYPLKTLGYFLYINAAESPYVQNMADAYNTQYAARHGKPPITPFQLYTAPKQGLRARIDQDLTKEMI